ncbi:MAG: ATP synthase F1 subunit delta [Patescibacteria group bacterium]
MGLKQRKIKDIANAGVAAAAEADLVKRYLSDMSILQEAVSKNPAVQDLLSDPSVDLENRLQALDKATQGIHEYAKNTLAILLKNNALHQLNDLMEALIKSAQEQASYNICQVISAIELNDGLKEKLMDALKKKFGNNLELEYKTDPGIIGGLEIICGEWRFRSTIQSKLEQLQQHLV